MAIDVAQGMVDKAFSDQSLLPTNQNQSQPDPLAILSSNATNEGGDSAYDGSSFAKDMFGVEDPSQILHLVGPHPNDPERVVYEMNGKKYGAPKDKPLDAVLESIWDKNSPGLWGSAVGSTLYGLPADMASAVAYGLGGLNLGEDAQEWRNYSDKLKDEYYQKYGQFMVPGVDAAMKQGKVFDYAMQTIGSGTPYMGLALAGGLGGGAAVGAAGMATTTAEGGLTLAGALGSFLGSTAVTSPVTIAQFADRQVAEQRAQGIENPEIDWGRAAALGTIAAGLQAVPAESILFGGPLLKTLEAWGAKTGTSASARILASIGDVAGSNALAGAGIAALSRFNADLPILDDGAKSEYVDAAIAGSLVGIPFGAYHGIRSKSRAHLPHIDENRPVDDILGEVGDKPDLPNSPKGSGGAETVYTGPDDFNTTLKLPGRKGLIYDPTYDYGIKDFADASNYLNSINYKRPDGTEGNGLDDFVYTWKKAKKPYSDEDMIEAARRAKWARDRQGNLARSRDGMMYETIMDLPQAHSDDPLILSKAAALTDKFGYDDTFVRGLSDKIVEKLYERNVAGELGRAANGVKYPKEVFDQVMEKLRNHVDENVVEDVRQYGSLYQRPQSKEREKNRLSQIRARVNRNPRRDLAEALMNNRRQQAGARAKAAAEGAADYIPVRTPTYDNGFVEQPPVDGEAFGPYAGLRKDPLGPRALLPAPEHFSGAKPENVVKTLVKAANRPGGFATKNMTKKQFAEFLFNTPFVKNLMKVWTNKDPYDPASGKPFDPKKNYTLEEAWGIMESGRKERQKMAAAAKLAAKKAAYPEPKLDAAGDPILKGPAHGGFRPTEYAKSGSYKFKALPEAEELIGKLRSRMEEIATQDRAAYLKDYPELGPALNQMAKAFAEMKPDIEIKGPRTKAIKGTKGFTESLARRAKVLDSVAHSLQNIGANKQVGDHFSTLVDHLIGGKEVTPRELSDGVTLLEAAFNINEKGTFEKGTLDATAIQNMYKTIRQNLGKKNIEKLNNKRQFLEDWYKEQHKINDADIASINTEDLEATAFFHYLDDSLKAKYKDFKDSPQKKLFESLEKSFKKLKNDLGNQGFEKVDDFFEYNNEAMNDKISPDTQRSGTAKRIVEDANFKAAQEEVKQANENAKAAAAERIADAPPPPKPPSNSGGSGGDGRFPKFNKVYKDHVDDVQSGMYRLWSTIASVPYLARHVEEWAIHFNDLQKQAHDQAAYDLRFTTKLTQLMHGPRKDRVWQEVNDAASLISHMRKSGQVLEKDAQGRYLIRNKDGELRAVDIRTTEAMDDLIDFIKEPMRVGRDIARNNLGRLYKDDGIHAGSSIEHIKRVIKDYDNRIDGNPFPAEASRLRMKKEALESSLQDIKEFEDHIDTKIPYIPYMRFGDHAVMVTNRKTGKKEYLGTINDVNKISHTTRNLTEQEVQQKINELGLREKYNTNDYEITHFKMTYDNIGRYIGRNAISTELLQGLIASGLNEHIKLADHLATDIKDAKEVMSDIRDAVKGSKERALKYMSSRGIGRFGLKSENIEGHSTDWARVLEAYKNIYSSHLAKKGKMIDLIEHQAALQEKGVPQYLAKRINNYLDYVNSPESDYAGLRTFNFVFAMGFNPASAILQLATIPNQVFGASLEFSPNILHNMSLLANETQRAIRYALPLYGMRIEKLDPYYESIINSEPGFFRASVKHDAMANKIMGYSETSTLRSRIAQNAADYGAMFIAPMERVTRISSFTFFHKALKENPANMERFIKAHEKDFNWQQFYENYKEIYDNETIAALYKMQETHAVFGKTARGTLQKGLGGSLFFPFSSYGQQMLEVMADQFMGHRGTAGRMAGLWSTTAFVAMAGLAGIPAYELLKTLYETYEEKANGRIADAEMDMKEAGIPDWLRKGVLSSATGLSLSHRLGQTLVGESLLQGLIQGEVKVGDLGGVPGRIMQNTITAAGALMDESDNRDVVQKLIPIMPTAAANLAKAYELTVHPENQLRTSKGKAFASPEDVGFNEIGATAMGFTPQKFEDARQKLHWQQQANVEFNQARSRFAESVAQALYQREVAIKNGDPEGASQALLQRNQLQKTMLEFMRENQIPANGDFWRSFNRNVRDRLMSKRFPGKILKPTRGELRHLDVLKEDDR